MSIGGRENHAQRRTAAGPLPSHVPALSGRPDAVPGPGDAGDRPADDLRSAPKRPDSQCPHGAALPDPQGGGNR